MPKWSYGRYYWKGWKFAWSDFLYHVFGLWTNSRVQDELTDAIHPDFGWAIRNVWDKAEPQINDAYSHGYEAGIHDKDDLRRTAFDEGYDEGRERGEESGYRRGYDDGEEEGFDKGMKSVMRVI